MTIYRNVAAALAAAAACLSLAACSAGITTASSASADAADSSRSAAAVASSASEAAIASASASASASRAAAGRMIKVAGLSATIPVPTGAKVVANMAMDVDGGKQTGIFLVLVTPAKVASFYTATLPRDGYNITANTLITQSGSAVAFIQFSGHGIKGTIDSVAKFPDSVGIPGLGHKNVTSVTITPR